ncbi:MAG: zinc ribbon domain-containing protein [Candidatus Saccharimonadales bacterium]|jgi:hypothetical protein
MYCSHCGHKADNNDTFCSNCGKKLGQPKKEDTSAKPLFKKISLTALELMSAQGDKWRKNTELVPDDCWVLFMKVSKSQTELFVSKNALPDNKVLLDKLEKSFFSAYSYGLWVWVAIKKQTNNAIFNGQIHFKYEDISKNASNFIDKWEGYLDGIDTDIPDDVKPSFAIAQAKMEDAMDNDKLLGQYLSSTQIWQLKSDLLGSIYRGYYLHKFFKKTSRVSS